MRKRYAERLDAMQAALAREMPDGARWTEPRSGHLVWLTLPAGTDPERLQHTARERGVAYSRGEVFHLDDRGADHLALSFAALEPASIHEGIARLGAVMREHATKLRRGEGRRRPSTGANAGGRRRGRRSVDAAS
jgi:DNA-binding transcriptional MocR family regulator